MNKVFLSIGSNKGNRLNCLKKAILEIQNLGSTIYLKTSPVYETKPMYNTNQSYFLNAVVEIDTSIDVFTLLEKTQSIEKKIGRQKVELKNQPRFIDIDILDYNNLIFSNEKLILPHPAISERLFVLKPWSDISPMYELPEVAKNIYELMSDMKINADIIKLHTNKI